MLLPTSQRCFNRTTSLLSFKTVGTGVLDGPMSQRRFYRIMRLSSLKIVGVDVPDDPMSQRLSLRTTRLHLAFLREVLVASDCRVCYANVEGDRLRWKEPACTMRFYVQITAVNHIKISCTSWVSRQRSRCELSKFAYGKR